MADEPQGLRFHAIVVTIVKVVATLGIVLVGLFSWVAHTMPRPKSPGELEAIQAEGRWIAAKVVEFRERSGRFPASLEAAIGSREGLRREDWQYGRSEDELTCFLNVGDYSEDRFTLSWNSTRGVWYLNN